MISAATSLDRAPAAAPSEAFGGRRVGPHLQSGAGLLKVAERAAEIGATAIQIFADNPTAWRRRSEPPDKVDAFRARLAEAGIRPLAVHGPYLLNLAGGDEGFWTRSVETLVQDLGMASLYGAELVTIHIGSHRGIGRDKGIRRLARGAREGLDRAGAGAPRLLLENAAGGGDTVGVTIEELAAILEALTQAGIARERIGFCLDTAHLWGAGYEITRPEVVDELLGRFDELLGLDLLGLIHLNDSRALLGSRADRHEHLGAGQIGVEGIRGVLCHPLLRGVPMLFETPGMDEGYDAVNLDRVRRMIAGEALPELPPEAFALRRSRSRTGAAAGRRGPSPEGT